MSDLYEIPDSMIMSFLFQNDSENNFPMRDKPNPIRIVINSPRREYQSMLLREAYISIINSRFHNLVEGGFIEEDDFDMATWKVADKAVELEKHKLVATKDRFVAAPDMEYLYEHLDSPKDTRASQL